MTLPVFIIMAGGRGERFWPKSRRNYPKQLLNLASDHSLLQDSVVRIRELTEDKRIYIVTNRDYAAKVREQLPMLPERNILVEPEGRNTAPCVGLAAVYVARHFPEEDPVMAILPSDPLVRKPEVMRKVLRAGIEYCSAHDSGVIYGMWPTRPETGYGYIQLGSGLKTIDTVDFHQVTAFKEKPNRETAERYVSSREYLWNGGIFLWRVSCLMREIERNLPELSYGLERIKPYIGSPDEERIVREVYPDLPAISVDYGILEKSRNLAVVPADFGWDDLGSWTSLERYMPSDPDGNVVQGELIGVECRNCTISSPGKTVAALGVSDLIIVDTGDVLMICSKDKAQDIKRLIEKAREQGREDLL
jgi:mannose-1-phosphate guanylyltransferase